MAQVFPLAADHSPRWISGGLIILPLLALLLYFLLAPRFVRFEVLPKHLKISGDPLYRRTIPLEDLDTSSAEQST